MDISKQFKSFAWCKPDWCYPSMSKETKELLKQCADLKEPEVSDDVDEVIARSKAFPIPFPIETVRLEKLKERRPIEKLKKNIVSTYPLIHERVLLLMTHFLIYKREFGSTIEKEFYKDMGVADLIDRILKKRAISFVGAKDAFMLMSGEEGTEGWETIGTMQQKPPLVLEDLLSYDELKLAAYVFVSGHTECINDGDRRNAGVVKEDKIEKSAIIIGTIGPRFQRPSRMDYEDILVTEEQNCPENGYGGGKRSYGAVSYTTCLDVLETTYMQNHQSAKHVWRQMWSEFFQVPSYTYEELSSYVNYSDRTEEKYYTDRFVKLDTKRLNIIFDNEVYYKRISILAETVLLEADARAKEEGKPAFVNIIGCGLGVWKISSHQIDVYVLTFLERTRHLLREDLLQHVSDVNFSYIQPSAKILAMFNGTTAAKAKEKKLFLEHQRHPRGGINVQILKRNPSSELTDEHAGKLLVMTYPWDGNAHPGNEFWYGSLTSSGDPAAACSTQVSELHNAHVNRALAAPRTRLAYGRGRATLHDYCRRLLRATEEIISPLLFNEGKSQNMDISKQFQSFAWCKPDWCYPSMGKETNELLKQCADIQEPEVSDNIDEVIARSKAFPIPYPIETVRLEKLKERRPIEKLKKNIVSTYPLIHERVLLLMTHFLIYKREFGSPIEKEFYKDMGVADLIDRILKKRAISFVGAKDAFMLMSGEEGAGGWETIGTMQQKPPLVLEDLLSYDELKLAAYVFVSGHTECINDGDRKNAGVVNEDNIEKSAIIIGTIGPRFQRPSRMDYEDILITEEQNCPENGYGEEVTPTTCLNVLKTTYVRNNQSAKHMWRQMWSEFFQVPSYTYQELSSYVNSSDQTEEKYYTDRFVKLDTKRLNIIFDNEVYYKRISILAETVLLEAEARAKDEGKPAFVNIIGCGLGVWKISSHQVDVYVLTFLERTRHLLRRELLQHVSDINLSYIQPSAKISAMFSTSSPKAKEKKLFLECKRHPRGGINVQILKRNPSSELTGEHAGKLLVMTYPWDGNAHPGNEFWYGSLTTSGDPAAACSTQVSELHNAHVNRTLAAPRTRLAYGRGLTTIHDYCQEQPA